MVVIALFVISDIDLEGLHASLTSDFPALNLSFWIVLWIIFVFTIVIMLYYPTFDVWVTFLSEIFDYPTQYSLLKFLGQIKCSYLVLIKLGK